MTSLSDSAALKRLTFSEDLNTRDYILIKGARVNNLKNINLALPRNRFIVVTGVSGSGKSSLAFDTLFAEGQRMYVESLNSYMRQFLGRMEKPDVDWIRGVSPAIAVEQKVNTRNPRSTVGTTTEIYDYLKLFFARIGKTYSPISGKEVRKDSVSDVVDFILKHPENTKYLLLAPLQMREDRSLAETFKILLQQGFTRIKLQDEVIFIEQLLPADAIPTPIEDEQETEEAEDWDEEIEAEAPQKKKKGSKKTNKEKNIATAAPLSAELQKIQDLIEKEQAQLFVLIDRGIVKQQDESVLFRLADSVQTAFYESDGICRVEIFEPQAEPTVSIFSDKFEADGIVFEEPTINFFSFNSPQGACRRCEGFGNILGIDEELVFPDKTLSVYEGAIAPWRTPKMRSWLEPLLRQGIEFDFPIHRPYEELDQAHKDLLWSGNSYFEGLDGFFNFLERESHQIQYRVLYSRYKGKQTCPDCKGSRIRKEAGFVKIGGKSIQDLVLMPIDELVEFLNQIQLNAHEEKIARRILIEIKNRLGYLLEVGLPYLTLNRQTATLSGGEFQRIKLATSLGSALVGSMYILDEPSIGLHPKDTQNLIRVLKQLRDLGNTVIVVEHEEEVIRAADYLIDIGMDAGRGGGEVIFEGTPSELAENQNQEGSYTAQYLSGRLQVFQPQKRREWSDFILIEGARENNLRNLDVKFPLGVLTAVTGVSGSGKSTLIRQLLYPALLRNLGSTSEEVGKMRDISGSLKKITQVEMVDQNPIGKSSRSNPVTYVKAYDLIRTLYAEQPLAVQRGYRPAMFSFNVEGGRCDNCQGEGKIKIEMQFMADIYLTCEVCQGKRFKKEILDITYQDKNITEVLEMTVDESVLFFKNKPRIVDKLLPLQEVGLGYVQLGQSSNTLSGGEAQRIKLASFLGKGQNSANEHIVFIFDEPTTGLHFHDIAKLLTSINALVDLGHTAIVIEHNTEMIQAADWVIDLGKDGGKKGGNLCFEGTPENLILEKDNYTAHFLRKSLEKK
ncbi:excinuclease ABC subunit UvrA [Hugenholtzia roseola]|uniref:excinuclease ABC subunit UvrA n=1 Tax=Hugenholtzia roseola TaxID=1002 RepID=UPI00047A6A9D|nr:excinuclease ABC subunit UvrA [Hugenholtzia roseola]